MSNAKISFDVRHAKCLQRWKEITVETFKDMIWIYTVGQKTRIQVHNAQQKMLYTSQVALFILRVSGQSRGWDAAHNVTRDMWTSQTTHSCMMLMVHFIWALHSAIDAYCPDNHRAELEARGLRKSSWVAVTAWGSSMCVTTDNATIFRAFTEHLLKTVLYFIH